MKMREIAVKIDNSSAMDCYENGRKIWNRKYR